MYGDINLNDAFLDEIKRKIASFGLNNSLDNNFQQLLE